MNKPKPEVPTLNINGLDIEVAVPMFPDNTQPNGFLSRDLGCQACWYYYQLAERLYDQTKDGIEGQIIDYEVGGEIPLWQSDDYLPIARSIEKLYGVDLNQIFRYWPAVKAEAANSGTPPPREVYMNPKKRLH